MSTIIRTPDFAAMSRSAANIIRAQVTLKPTSVLGLATGSTPIGLYQQLVAWYNAGEVDFSACAAANLDEYVGLTPDSNQSYAWFMHHHLFQHINVPAAKRHIPNGSNENAAEECQRYTAAIRALGGIDLQLLGLGLNGHIGFNEPSTTFARDTNCVTLTPSTLQANARFFGPDEAQPTRAYTMGIKTIMDARSILLVVSGKEKAEILYQSLCGPITPQVPASILQLHQNLILVVDEAAGALLPQSI